MTKLGLVGPNPAAPPYSNGPYTWDQPLALGGVISNGLLTGTTSSAFQSSANGERLLGAYLYSTATGGDQRAAYFRLWSAGNGTGVSGEAVRAYHTCTGITGPVHGIHASVAYSTNMYCNNEAIAVRGTIEVPNSAVSKGEYAALQAEFYSNGSTARMAPSGSVAAAFIRCIATGSEATAPANLDTDLFLFDFSNMSGTQYLSAGSGKFIDTDKTALTAYAGLRIKLPNGNTAWLPVVSA